MQNAPIQIAVVGLGRMGRIYARTVAEEQAGARLVAVVDPDARRRSEVGEALGVARRFADAGEALALPEVDAVVIATPTSTHRDLVVEAARAGKAIFCEKPLALTLDATREALAAVERAGVPLQVGFMRRFDAAYMEARRAVATGRIGRPLTFRSIGRDPFCPRPEFADPAVSGGLILDMGIHDFDLATWLMDVPVERVTAEGAQLVCDELRAVGDYDNAVVNLRYADGALGQVEVSRTAFYGYDVRTEVLGSEGAVRVGGEPAGPVRVLTRDEGAADDYLMRRFGDAYRAQLRAFLACLREGREPAVSGADALAAFELGLAATFAARTGQPVTLDAVRAGWTPAPIHSS